MDRECEWVIHLMSGETEKRKCLTVSLYVHTVDCTVCVSVWCVHVSIMVACPLNSKKRVLLFVVEVLQKCSLLLLLLFNQNVSLIFCSWFFPPDKHVSALLRASLSSCDWTEAAPRGECDVTKTAYFFSWFFNFLYSVVVVCCCFFAVFLEEHQYPFT